MNEDILTDEVVLVKKNLPIPDGMNFSFLKKQGVDISQKLAGDIWTDYNEHDPGVTILEQLSFTLTELAYKAHFKVEDILFPVEEKYFNLERYAFFSPQDAFTCNPQNINDYRRLIIDHLYPEVENSWLVPLDSSDYGINMSGLFGLYIQVRKGEEENKDEIIRKVNQLVHNHRNLCEDFHTIKVLKPLNLSVRCEIALDQSVIVDTTVGRMLYQLSMAVNPKVRFHSNEELEEEGMSLDQVYDGTYPSTGYIFPDDLYQSAFERFMNLPTPADLINVIRSFKGVEDIKNFEIGYYIDKDELPPGFHLVKIEFDGEIHGYYITSDVEDLPNGHDVMEDLTDVSVGLYKFAEGENIPSDFYPSLDIEAMLDKNLFKVTVDKLEYDYDHEIVDKSLSMMNAEDEQQYQKMVDHPKYVSKATKSRKDIEAYYSVQFTFPEIYGITARGLPNRVPVTRKVQALQLKAYLFFFEQIMANYLSQLTHFNQLFSLEAETAQTYFYQIPKIPNLEKVLGKESDQSSYLATIEDVGRDYDPVMDRKSRALDHLLARFGEEFLSDPLNQLNQKASVSDTEEFGQQIIQAKVRFLKNIVELTRERGKGFNYQYSPEQANEDDTWNVAVIKKRLSLFFNISDHGHYALSGVVREDPDIELSRKGSKKNEKKDDDRRSFNFSSDQQEVLSEVVFHGLDRENFTVSPAQGKPGVYEVFFHRAGESHTRSKNPPVFTGNSREDCERAILTVIRKIRDINTQTEGFHLIEHILLRPIGEPMYRAFVTKGGRKLLETGTVPKEGAVSNVQKGLMRFRMSDDDYQKLQDKWNTGKESKTPLKTPIKIRGNSVDIVGNQEDGFTVELRDKDNALIAYKSGFVYRESAAEELVNVILKALMQWQADKGKINIRLEEVIPRAALLSDDFFSFAFSVVLPSWPARFRNDKFKMLFEQVLKVNTPAHLNVKCFWVDIEEMTAFEKVYGKWLDEKAKPVPSQPQLDDLSYAMIAMLKYFENPYDERMTREMNLVAASIEDL